MTSLLTSLVDTILQQNGPDDDWFDDHQTAGSSK